MARVPPLFCGFKQARGTVITMDADLQGFADEIPGLYKMIVRQTVAIWFQDINRNVTTPRRRQYLPNCSMPRHGKSAASRIGGRISTRTESHRKEVVKNIEVYGEMHRYIPIWPRMPVSDKIVEKVVQHQARKYGTSKFVWTVSSMAIWPGSHYGSWVVSVANRCMCSVFRVPSCSSSVLWQPSSSVPTNWYHWHRVSRCDWLRIHLTYIAPTMMI